MPHKKQIPVGCLVQLGNLFIEYWSEQRSFTCWSRSLLDSSISRGLLLELVASGYFANHMAPRNLLLFDPIVIPSDKSLFLVGFMLGYFETDQSTSEDKVFYHFRPQETLLQLQDVLTVVRKDLESGITLPTGCGMKVYKSRIDASADLVSAVLIYQGAKTAEGMPISVELIDSKFHVYTQLSLREQVTAKDRQNQTDTFTDIVGRVLR